MGNVPSKPSFGSTSSSSSLASRPSSPKPRTGFSSITVPFPPRSSFSIESSTPKIKEQLHKRSHSHSTRPPVSRNQNSDSGNSTGKSQHELVLDTDNSNAKIGTNTNTFENEGTVGAANLKTARAEITDRVTFSGSPFFQLDKPLPTAPSLLLPPALPEKDTPLDRILTAPSHSSSSSSIPKAKTAAAAVATTTNSHQRNNPTVDMITTSSISQQSFHSQSSLSDKSTVSNSSGGSGSGASLHTTTIPTRSVTGGTIESLSHHGLQRFPTGENEYKIKSKSKSGDQSTRQSHDGQIKASRTTSTVSSSSARSSSGNSGFKFTKPNLTFKPLLYNQGNDSKSQQSLYKHTNNSSSSASPNGQQQMPDLLANSPFPSILLSIRLPQSLLNKYVIDQESFRQGKGIWGIGRYSCTISVLSKTTGKKYVIKRVSKSLLPPSAYYHYPTTAHRLCTCPACKASRDHLLMTGQLEGHELEKIKEVLVIQNRGKKDLPQLPPSSPPHHQQKHPQRPLSASSISPPSQKETKEKRRSFNMYNNYNASMPNHHVKFLTFSSNSSPHNTPANSRPTTPSPSPLRLFSSPVPSSPPPMSPSGKTHNRSHSQSCPATSQNAQSHNNPHSPLLPSATPLSWPHKESESQVSQTSNAQFYADISSGSYSARPPVQTRVSHSSYSQKKRPALKRHASTPNMSRPVTGLKVLEDDPSRLDQLKQLSRHGWHPQDSKDRHGQREAHPYESGTERRLFDSPFNTTSTMPSSHMVTKVNTQDRDSDDENTYERLQCKISKGIEREVDPFDTNGGEFKTMDPASPKLTKPAELPGFVPPPHALPMELVLLQTYNDSDHLPEHHEWTQDKEYWYYVTKSHGVRRRKLKKVSTWWLDVGSLGSAFTIGSSSNEPIATKPIYNMGHSTGDSTPIPSESPLSSEMALSNAFSSASATGQGQVADDCHTPKQSISSITSQDSYASSIGAPFKRQSSPRNSHMGKYFYVDWDEYTSL